MHRTLARVYASHAYIIAHVNACRHGCLYVCMYARIICILLSVCSPCYRNTSTHMETYTFELRLGNKTNAITKHTKHSSVISPPHINQMMTKEISTKQPERVQEGKQSEGRMQAPYITFAILWQCMYDAQICEETRSVEHLKIHQETIAQTMFNRLRGVGWRRLV